MNYYSNKMEGIVLLIVPGCIARRLDSMNSCHWILDSLTTVLNLLWVSITSAHEESLASLQDSSQLL